MGAFETFELQHASPSTDLGPWLLRTTLALLRGALRGGGEVDEWIGRHPVLAEAFDAAAAAGLTDLTLEQAIACLDDRLQRSPDAPLERLRGALSLGPDAMGCFVAAGLADADPRLAPLFDELHGRGGRPTRATLVRVFGGSAAARGLQALRAAGCLEEADHALAAPAALWDLAAGLPPGPGSWRHAPAATLLASDDLILPPALHQRVQALLLDPEPAPCWLLRGSAGSGRRALAGALARARGLGLIEALSPAHAPALGAAAALLGALPLVEAAPAPGEHLVLLPPAAAPRAMAVRAPRQGGVSVEGRLLRRVDFDPPAAEERRRHWRLALGGTEPDEALVSLRLPRGTLHRVARVLPAARPCTLADAVAEVEEQGRHALDGIARRIAPARGGEVLALPDPVRDEFDALVARCRQRDRLADRLPAAYASSDGVRALFKGPSGTGKTLAARHLAAALQRPLYRVDLAATVSKYIGETERNLERVFEAAESLDIVLLLDEGDALLAGRTGVGNATDRYANLETNYLLQRLEQYDGVLIVTTNAAERIDAAFTRRMDVTIDFPLPDALTRLELWEAHLGTGQQADPAWLESVALRCALSGGQIRNAALHAALLALERGGTIGCGDIGAALEREYRKSGQQCPSLDEGG